MTLEQYAYIAEILGVVLVVASLIYLARQIGQNTEMMRAESRNVISVRHQEELFAFLDHPDIFGSLMDATASDETIRHHAWLIAHIRGREHEWFQVQSGALDPTAWRSYASALSLVLSTPHNRAWWGVMKKAFDSDFVAQVDDPPRAIVWCR